MAGCTAADARVFESELRRAGFAPECRPATTEAEYRAALAGPVDLILADGENPDLDVLRALQIVRQRAPYLPLIVLTTVAGEERAGEWIKLGAADYLFKDRPARLGLAVTRALEQREVRTDARGMGEPPPAHVVLDALSGHIAVLDATGTIIATNRAWERFAREAGDPELVRTGIGMNYFAICRAATGEWSDEAMPALEGMLAVLAGEREHFRIEYPCHSATTQRWFALHVTPLPGNSRGLVLAHYDITTRKQSELSLRESEQRFRTLFESSPDAILLIDPHAPDVSWPIVDCNEIACQMNGYSRAELIGQSIDLLHGQAADPAERAGYLAKLRRDGNISAEAIHYHKDGQLVWIESSSSLISLDGRELVLGIDRDVTDLKATQAALRESEERFRSAYDYAAIGMAIVDLDGHWMQVNRALADIVGYTEEELRETTFQAITHPADLELDMRLVRELLADNIRTYQMEKRYFHKHGQTVTVLLSVALVRDPAGKPLYFIAQIQDISERKRTEEALRVAEARYRTLIEQVPAIIYTAEINAQSSTDFVSSQIGSILGFSPEEWTANPNLWIELVHPDDRELVLEAVQRTHTTNESVSLEYRSYTRNGDLVWLNDTARTVRAEDGQPLFLHGIILDITERKRTEEALRRAETRYRTLIEQLPAIIYTADVNSQSSTSYVSPQIETILGYTPAEWLANPTLWIELVHPDDKASVLAAVEQAQASDTPVPLEYRSYTRNGEVIWLYDAARVVRDEEGQALFLQGVTLDITERKRFEYALIEERALLAQRVAERTADLSVANAELARTAQLKDEFLASMSHELRTPLNAVLGLSEALQELVYGPLNERQQTALHNITISGQHLLDLINDILDLAKIGAGKLTLDLEDTPIAHVCESSARIVKPLAEKKGQSFSMSIDPAVQLVSADARRLKQVLVNLLSNAIKFTPEGGAIGLEVAGDRARQAVDISVWDTGIGIAPDQLALLFQPFVQLDRRLARQYAGTGLGLSLVARMVTLHGGGVAVSSTVGSGSRFTVALPWPAAEVGEMPSLDHPPCVVPSAPRPAIVLADDDETSSALVSEHLRHAGYQVIIARNGAEAIAQAREVYPALVMISVQLQGMPGVELARRLRADDALPNMPIIMLNGRALPGDREQCLAAGSDMYLTKPVGRHLLLDTIDKLLHDLPSCSLVQ